MNKLHILIVFLLVSLGLQAQVVRHDGVDKEDPENPTNMDITDQERYESKTFIHEGLSNRTMMEECEKLKDSNACQGRGKTEFMGVDSTMFKMLSQVYAMIIGMGDSKFKSKPANTTNASGSTPPTAGSTTPPATGGTTPPATGSTTPPATGSTTPPAQTGNNAQAGNNNNNEGKEDYCRYVAVATEMGGQLMQQMQQSRISANSTPGENVQKTQLYKAAASHRAKAQTSTIAAIGWGGTFGCYAYMGTMGGIVTDGFYFLKLAGAGLMTSFYISEIKKNNEYADEVSAIADKLPGAGDCNRVTQNDCYCAQPETMYDPQYCMQNLHNKNIGKESIRMTCVDDQLKADPQCRCLASDSCFDKQFMSMVGGTNFGNAFLGSPDGDAFKALARGELKGGKTVMASPSQAAARHSNRMKDVANQLGIPDASVPSNMKGGLASLQAMGLPTSLAKTIAGTSFKIPGADKYVGKFQSAFTTPKYTSYSRSGARSLNYGGGNNFRKSNNNGGFENPFDKLNKGKSRTASSVNTLEFAQQATEKAQITQDKGRPIFEIISRRYQISGLRRLNIE